MVRFIINDNENDKKSLRFDILKILADSKTSSEEDLKALDQCSSFIRDRIKIEAIAKECGLKLTGFLMNKELELYYDVKRGRHDLGYIAKGWSDPGFRIGNILKLPNAKLDSFKINAYKIMRFCTTNGIGITVEETENHVEISMDGVIYDEGFNKATFIKTVDALNECVEKAQELIEV
ncbi:MAG: hypothetical protein WC299_06790 [Kiritimatiellia bacterium]